MQVRVRAAFRGVYRHVIPQFIYRCATCTYTDMPTPVVQPMPAMQFHGPPQFQPLPAVMDMPHARQTLQSPGIRFFNQKAVGNGPANVLALADRPANVEPHAAAASDAADAAASDAADVSGSQSASVIVECACMLQAPQYNVVTFAMIAVSFGELRWPPPWGQCDV